MQTKKMVILLRLFQSFGISNNSTAKYNHEKTVDRVTKNKVVFLQELIKCESTFNQRFWGKLRKNFSETINHADFGQKLCN